MPSFHFASGIAQMRSLTGCHNTAFLTLEISGGFCPAAGRWWIPPLSCMDGNVDSRRRTLLLPGDRAGPLRLGGARSLRRAAPAVAGADVPGNRREPCLRARREDSSPACGTRLSPRRLITAPSNQSGRAAVHPRAHGGMQRRSPTLCMRAVPSCFLPPRRFGDTERMRSRRPISSTSTSK